MTSKPLKVVEDETDARAPILDPQTAEHLAWLTYLLDGAEKALVGLDHRASHAFGATAKDLVELKDRLEAELATFRGDERATRLMPHISPVEAEGSG